MMWEGGLVSFSLHVSVQFPQHHLLNKLVLILFCSWSRLGRFTWDSGRWKEICGSFGMSEMPLFQGGVIHALHKPWVSLWEALTPLYTKCTQSQQGAKCYITAHDSVHAGPYSRVYECCLITVAGHLGEGTWLTPFSLQAHCIFLGSLLCSMIYMSVFNASSMLFWLVRPYSIVSY